MRVEFEMEFRKIVRKARLLDPGNKFKPQVQPIEYRKDLLTDRWCRINIKRAERVKQVLAQSRRKQKVDQGLLKLIDETKEKCFFCPKNIERDTPEFSPDIWKSGRIQKGQCVVFPNLFPFSQYHAVATISSQHYLDLDEFSEQMVIDNLTACRDYIRAIHKKDKRASFPIYNWNHLPPAAASIIHPHVQVLLDREPTSYLARLLNSSKEYFMKTGKNFWKEIVREEERLSERFISKNKSLSCITSFAPQGNREIQIIFTGISNLSQLDKTKIEDFSRCLIKILRGYKKLGVGSFNLSSFSGPMNKRLDYYWLNLKIISRPSFQAYYTSDTGFMERFHYQSIIEQKPEDVATEIRKFVKSANC